MSRDRELQRKKKSELARQLGVGRADVEEQKALAERERVTRPALHLRSRTPTRGLLRRLLDREEETLVLALYLVEVKGARLVHALALDDKRHDIAKVTYHRPAHFVVVLVPTVDPAALLAELATAQPRLDGLEVASDALASAEWEKPRRVRVEGLASASAGAALSIRGVARSAATHAFPLEKCTATIDIEI